jgi:hypothetical protein
MNHANPFGQTPPHRSLLGQTMGASACELFAMTAPGADISFVRSVESQWVQFTVFTAVLL